MNMAPDNKVQGNFIGLKADGGGALGNGRFGLNIASGSHDALIGGTTAGAGNVISDNHTGIIVSDGPSTGILIHGNLIGTDAAGAVDLGNNFNGITIGSLRLFKA